MYNKVKTSCFMNRFDSIMPSSTNSTLLDSTFGFHGSIKQTGFHLSPTRPPQKAKKEEAESSAPSWKWAIFLLEVPLQQTLQSLAVTGLIMEHIKKY